MPRSTPPPLDASKGGSKLKQGFALLKETATEWNDDNALRLSAALSYYTTLSLAPLLLVVVSVAGLAFGRDAVEGELARQLSSSIGPDSAKMVQSMVAQAYRPGASIVASVVGFVVLLVGATGVFAELQSALNLIWGVKPKPDQGLKYFVRVRLLSFTALLGVGFLLLVSLAMSAGLTAASGYIEARFSGLSLVFRLLEPAVSFVVIAALFALMFKLLPDVELTFRDVAVGAAATAFLFTIGKLLIGLYIGKSSVSSSYGAAGSLAAVLIWIYYSSLIFFFGAEFTQVYTRRLGHPAPPEAMAEAAGNKDIGVTPAHSPSSA